MKKIRLLDTLVIIILVIVSCSQKSETKLTGTKWANFINTPLNCVDSIEFITDSTLIWYNCETSWDFDANYEINGDFVTVYIVMAQFEMGVIIEQIWVS